MALRRYLVEEITLDCVDGVLTRREALRRLGLLGVSGAAAAALLAACGDDDDDDAGDATQRRRPRPMRAAVRRSGSPVRRAS